MSSKSKRGNKPSRRSSDAHQGVKAMGAQAPSAPAEAEHHDPLEDYIETPKGRSVWAQLFLIALLILLLIIFIVPFAFMNALSGPEEVAELSWEHPNGDTVELSYREFIEEKRRFNFLLGQGQQNPDDAAVASAIVYDAVAEHAGIEIADEELFTEIDRFVQGSFGGDVQAYRAFMTRGGHPGGAPGFEQTVRRFMRGRRYATLLSQLVTVPDPAEIEELWNEQHVEYRFQYVELAVEDVLEAARAEVPQDELEAWFDAKQEWEKNGYKTPERYSAELVYFPVGTEAPAVLLERFPEPEDVDPEQRAEDYYNRVFFSRFLRPEPQEGEEPSAERYLSLEEVKDTALAEAPVFYAMQRWLDDVNAREAVEGAEPVDAAAEAAELGLAFLGQDEALDNEAWTALENLGGVRLASSMRRTQPGSWIVGITAESGALIAGRVTGKVEAELPPFEEIRDEVADDWVEERAADLAVERLEELRQSAIELAQGDEADAGDPVSVDESIFRTAAEVAGHEVLTRDWLDRAAPPTADPKSDDAAHQFIRSRADLYELEQGQLSEPALGPRRERAYLVRAAGSREVALDAMQPRDYSSLAQRSSMNARIAFNTSLYSEDELERVYGLRWPRREVMGDEPLGTLTVEDDEEQPEGE